MGWNNNAEIRKNTPKPKAVYEYWKKTGLPPAKNHEFTYLEEKVCFACGIFHHLHRAHIVPISSGGPNTVENIHLLCEACHSRSEANPKYWNWFGYMRKYEWRDRSEWCIKILEMNGVNFEEEYKKKEHLSWEDWFVYLFRLLKDNGIGLTPMDDDEDSQDWKIIYEKAFDENYKLPV